MLIGFTVNCYSQNYDYDNFQKKYKHYSNENKLDSALFFARQMNSWALKNEGDTSLRFAVSYRYIGNCFTLADSALYYYDLSLLILKKQKREIHADYSKTLNNIGNIYKNSGDFVKAEKYYKEAIIIFEKLIEKKCFDRFYLISSLNLSRLYYFENQQFDKVEEPLLNAINNSDQFVDNMNLDLGDCYDFLANYYRRTSQFDKAIYYFDKVIEIVDYHKLNNTSAYAITLSNIGILYQELHENKIAEDFFLEALEINTKLFGTNDESVAYNLRNLGNIKTIEGDYEKAKTYLDNSNLIILKIFRFNHREYATNLVSMAMLYGSMWDLKKGIAFLDEALSITNINITQKANIYSNRATMCMKSFLYQEATVDFNMALSTLKELFSEENQSFTIIYHNLGCLYNLMADFDKSLKYHNKAFLLRKKLFNANNPEIAYSLNCIADCYTSLGDFGRAKDYSFKALDILNLNEGSNEIKEEIAATFSELVEIYSCEKDYKLALKYANEALKIDINIFGFKHRSTAASLNHLGLVYKYLNKLDSAEHFIKKAIEAYDEPSFKTNLALVFVEKGNFKEAHNLLNQVLNFDLTHLPPNHPHLSETYFRLGRICFLKNDFLNAEKNLEKSGEIKTYNLIQNFSFLSSNEKKIFWYDNQFYYDYLNYFSSNSFLVSSEVTSLNYNNILFTKSLLLETSLELDRAISNSSDPLLNKQFNELKQLRRIYNKLQSEGIDKKEIMDRYKFQADSLDKILVNKLGEYAASKRKFEITWKDVQANLTSADAAIEFARYYDFKDSIYKYMALVVRPEYEYPKLVKLGSEVHIKNASYQKEFSELYNYVWRGVDSLLLGVKTVYYSPVGELNNISFSALISDIKTSNQIDTNQSNWYYLMDRYELHQLTTTRYLADESLKKNKPLPLSIKLVGGVNYSELPLVKDSISKEESNEDFAFQINLQNEMKVNGAERGGKINYLKGSEIEVNEVSKLLQDSGWSTTTLSGRNAGEYQFKEELNKTSPGILHIATHGFAFPEKEIKNEESFQMNEKSSYKVSDDPMVRCGLMFSGANISWSDDPQKMIQVSGDDGILTAAEVSNMDLSNTKLAVLSACETGLGKIESSEGTFGLKRGFKLAGVDKIIVSLWKVPDNESMELMTLFYSELAKTKDIDNSFNKAQKEMRNRFPYEPEKWAGFVLVR